MKILPKVLWWLAGILLLAGVLSGGFRFVFSRAANLCLSCMGLQ